jgi:cathepsin X
MPHIYHVCSTSFESLKLTSFPNATVAEYGSYDLNDTVEMIMAEIYARGPVKAAVNGTAITEYQGGIINDPSFANMGHSHGVSLVGWGTDSSTDRKHWIVRNSWGQYWGEMGFFRVEMGSNLLGIESHLAWATPGRYSTWNFPCDEQGSNCKGRGSVSYVDPSNHMSLLEQQ